MTTDEKSPLPADGIPLRRSADSLRLPCNFRREAQDPAPDAPEGVEGPTEKEMVEAVEDSPAAEWQKYLQPIIREIKLMLRVPVELRNSFTISEQGDPSLGFHITGVVQFTEEIPPSLEEVLAGRPLRYKAYISPDGALADQIDLLYHTDDPYEMPQEPTFRSNPNQYSI